MIDSGDGHDMVVTTVRLDRATWLKLRDLAAERAAKNGGRPSQAQIMRELVESATHDRTTLARLLNR